MFISFTFFGACIFMKLVTANPLLQSIQPCLVSNQPVYQQPYEPFVFQSSFSPHSQITYQNHVYQPLGLTDQINQIYWEKLLSNPTLRSILDTNNYDQNFNTQANPTNLNNNGVNNYDIMPSHVKNNETKQKTNNNLVVNEFNEPINEIITNKRRKKNLDVSRKETSSKSVKTRRKQSINTNTFQIENIKCYTPAEVFDESNTRSVKKNRRNKDVKKKEKKGSDKSKSKKESDNKENSKKIKRKSKRKKPKKSADEQCKDTAEHISTKTKKRRKSKKDKEKVIECECETKADVMENICKEEICQKCNEDIDEVFNLRQDCLDLDNRCTRNSKNDPVKDFRIHPNLPDDISKSYASYINDLFSNTQVNSNLFYGNMYPFDLNQIYQMPQYMNTDVQGNRSKGKHTRHKKKPKKSSKKKKKEESNNNVEGATKKSMINTEGDTEKSINNTIEGASKTNNHDVISIKNNNNTDDIATKNNHNDHEIDVKMNNEYNEVITTKISNNSHVEDVIKKPEISTQKDNKSIEVTTESTEITDTTSVETTPTTESTLITTEESTTTVKITSTEQCSIEDGLESFEELIQNTKEIELKVDNQNEKLVSTESPEKIKIKEIYDLISETIEKIVKDKIKEKIKELNKERMNEKLYDEPPLLIDPYGFHKPNLGFLEGIPSIYHNKILDDYYPDFTADNHAYLVSGEEMDVRNIHDRYFYTTHKIDSEEAFNSLETHSKEDSFDNDKVIDDNDNRSKAKDEEIVFKTPPGLDVPGFVTRKINNDKKDSTEVYYQNSNDNFDGFNFDNFADNSDQSFKAERYTKEKDIDKDSKSGSVVETVYARSKVVKYGQGQSFEKSKKENKMNKDEDVQKNGGKTIVLAKSVRPEDIWKYF